MATRAGAARRRFPSNSHELEWASFSDAPQPQQKPCRVRLSWMFVGCGSTVGSLIICCSDINRRRPETSLVVPHKGRASSLTQRAALTHSTRAWRRRPHSRRWRQSGGDHSEGQSGRLSIRDSQEVDCSALCPPPRMVRLQQNKVFKSKQVFREPRFSSLLYGGSTVYP